MKNIKSILSILSLYYLLGCGVGKMQKQGKVIPGNFDTELDFTTAKSIILIPGKINTSTKNFLFDTGADLSLVQRDSLIGKTGKWTGASKRKMELGTEVIQSFQIKDVEFVDTYAVNGDLIGLKEQIPNFGGLIGQSIISKANWLIDYPNKRIRITDKDLSDGSYQTVEIERKNGNNPYTDIVIDGQKLRVVIDFGSSSEFNLPEESKLAKLLVDKYNFKNNQRERYTLGGLQMIKERVGTVPLIKLGNMEFKNVNATINSSSQPRIGIGFFKDCIIYIDNTNEDYKIKK